MNKASDEPAAPPTEPPSWRDALARPLRKRPVLAITEPLFIALPFILRALGVIRNASLLLFLLGWLSLWLRREGWWGLGMRRPANLRRTLLLGVGIGIAYNAADILVFLPALRRLTGHAIELGQFSTLRGHFGALLSSLAVTWIFAAFIEEMAYRGYALNRIADLLGRTPVAFALSAIVVTGLFGLAHVSQGLTGVLDNLLAGAFFATLYFVSGKNLWLPIIVHGVVDTTSLLLLFFGFVPH